MKILFVHHAGGLGGAPKSLAQILTVFDNEKDVDSRLLLIRNGPVRELFKKNKAAILFNRLVYPFDATEVSGFSFITFIRNWVGFVSCFFSAFYESVFRNRDIDILYLNTTCLVPFAFFFKLFRPSIRVVSHVREPLLDGFHGSFIRMLLKRTCDDVIAISKYDGDCSKVKNFHLVYNSIDLDYFNSNTSDLETKNKVKESLGLSKNDFLVMYCARFSSENGLLELLSNWRQENRANDNIKLMLVGFPDVSNDYILSLRNYIDDPDVIIIPMTPDVQKYYSIADAFISPFVKPHFSRGVVEASAFSIPSVITDVGGQNELVIHNSTGVIVETIPSMIKALDLLYENKDKIQDMGFQARKYAEELFDQNKNVLKIRDIIKGF